MRRFAFSLICAPLVLNSGALAQADQISSRPFGSGPEVTALTQLHQTRDDRSDWLRLVAGDERRPLPPEFMKEVEALRTQITKLWNPPTGAKDPQELTVEIDIKLNRDGMLAGPPKVLNSSESALFKVSRDSALSAIQRSQPFTMLRPEHYDLWKEIVVTFDAHALSPPPR